MSDIAAKVTITHHVQGQGGTYVAHIEGESTEGFLEWEPHSGEGDVRIATHTVVPSEISGRGIAALLVQRLVEDANQLGFTVVPRCSYVAAKFDENPDWEGVRAS